MTHAFNAPQLLGVEVQQISRSFMLIAHHRLARLKVAPLREPGTAQYPANGTLRHPKARRNRGLRQASAAQFHDHQCLVRRDRARAALRTRRTIDQSGLTFSQKAPQPLTCGGLGYPSFTCGFGLGKSLIDDHLNQLDSTCERESCILVNVHSAEPLRGLGWVAPPSFSDSVRMNSNNLLELHN